LHCPRHQPDRPAAADHGGARGQHLRHPGRPRPPCPPAPAHIAGAANRSEGCGMIRLDAVSKVFPGSNAAAVDRVTMEVPDGEICILLGPSGCGKTTTLKMVNRLVEPSSGTITIDGRDAAAVDAVTLRRSIGYVIQQIGLFPNKTV